jgi:hypothetical protein
MVESERRQGKKNLAFSAGWSLDSEFVRQMTQLFVVRVVHSSRVLATVFHRRELSSGALVLCRAAQK